MRNFWESIYCPNCITGYNPFLLRHMNEAIEKLVYAVNNRKKIVVYGTSSVDAISVSYTHLDVYKRQHWGLC